MRCQVCGTPDQHDGRECDFCGATVRYVGGRGAPLGNAPGLGSTETWRSGAADEARRRRRRLFEHYVVGAVLFLVFGAIVYAIRLVRMVILLAVSNPASVAGGEAHGETGMSLLLGLGQTLVYSLVIGGPMGLVISRFRLTLLPGGVAGLASFAIGIGLLRMGDLLAALHPGLVLFMGPFMGFLVGAVMSVHVRSEETL